MMLILCALGYTMLQPAHLGVHVAVVVLQILQGKEEEEEGVAIHDARHAS